MEEGVQLRTHVRRTARRRAVKSPDCERRGSPLLFVTSVSAEQSAPALQLQLGLQDAFAQVPLCLCQLISGPGKRDKERERKNILFRPVRDRLRSLA